MSDITVVGAGLAGCEAAWQLAQRGVSVRLVEMKPLKMSPAHSSADFAELVCSNSFRGDRLENAVGLLKEELRRSGSLIMACADATKVEAGGCLAVDRHGFSALVSEKIRSHPMISVAEEEAALYNEAGAVVTAADKKRDKILQYGARVWGIDGGSTTERIDQIIARTREFFASLGLATSLTEAEISESVIDIIAERFNRSGVHHGEAANVDGEMARRILTACLK